jgi:hypothetical protein
MQSESPNAEPFQGKSVDNTDLLFLDDEQVQFGEGEHIPRERGEYDLKISAHTYIPLNMTC